MKVEYVAKVPQELLAQKKGEGGYRKYDLSKLFSGEEKVALISCDSAEDLKSAYNSIRQRLRYKGKNKEFGTLKNTTTNQLYVYKINMD